MGDNHEYWLNRSHLEKADLTELIDRSFHGYDESPIVRVYLNAPLNNVQNKARHSIAFFTNVPYASLDIVVPPRVVSGMYAKKKSKSSKSSSRRPPACAANGWAREES